MLLQYRKRKKEKAKPQKAAGLRDWDGEREQPEHMMPSACAARIRVFEFQPRVFMRSGRVWWEKTKNMAS